MSKISKGKVMQLREQRDRRHIILDIRAYAKDKKTAAKANSDVLEELFSAVRSGVRLNGRKARMW